MAWIQGVSRLFEAFEVVFEPLEPLHMPFGPGFWPFELDFPAATSPKAFSNQFGAMGAKVSTQTRSGRALFEELRRRDLPVMPAVPVDDEKKGGLLSHGL